MIQFLQQFFKGFAMGTANVIPGVSGGTIALITGIFERLINAIKSFNLTALKLLIKGKIKAFAKHTDLGFLFALGSGVIISIISLARVLDYLFTNYPVHVWAFFFGLILASVYFVGKTINKWNFAVILFFIIGTAIAIGITLLRPASENDNFFYLILSGIASVCSMILPGLSGSFILILMGNYKLIAIDAINNADINVLIPMAIGGIVGLVFFSHLLSWVYKKFRNQTIAILSGFILGSLGIIWPWKTTITETFGDKVKIIGYKWELPEINTEFFIALGFIFAGIVIIALIEIMANSSSKNKANA